MTVSPRAKAGALIDDANVWQSMDWKTTQRQVRRLQMRIAKAKKDGKRGKVKALQWLLTRSHHAKLLAVKRVTSNKGKNTPGVDGILWKGARAKMQAVRSLRQHGYKAQPLRRIYIPKKNGKNGITYPTHKGTPQGGVISPTLANMTLDGLERAVRNAVPRLGSRVNFIRYADDFIITGKSKHLLVEHVLPVVKQFLAERGLTLSEEKTKFTYIRDGFTFLGQNLPQAWGHTAHHPIQ